MNNFLTNQTFSSVISAQYGNVEHQTSNFISNTWVCHEAKSYLEQLSAVIRALDGLQSDQLALLNCHLLLKNHSKPDSDKFMKCFTQLYSLIRETSPILKSTFHKSGSNKTEASVRQKIVEMTYQDVSSDLFYLAIFLLWLPSSSAPSECIVSKQNQLQLENAAVLVTCYKALSTSHEQG